LKVLKCVYKIKHNILKFTLYINIHMYTTYIYIYKWIYDTNLIMNYDPQDILCTWVNDSIFENIICKQKDTVGEKIQWDVYI
jgi:hypothetical protein